MGRAFIHELGDQGLSQQMQLAMDGGGDIYQVRWGKREWVTHIKEVSDIARDARQGHIPIRQLEEVVREGITKSVRRQRMLGMVGEFVTPRKNLE